MLAMSMVVHLALLGAPIADFRTEFAQAADKLAVASHRLSAQQTDIEAVAAAVGAIGVESQLFADHEVQAAFAVCGTFVTGFDTSGVHIDIPDDSRVTN
jgi:hypothetical protein